MSALHWVFSWAIVLSRRGIVVGILLLVACGFLIMLLLTSLALSTLVPLMFQQPLLLSPFLFTSFSHCPTIAPSPQPFLPTPLGTIYGSDLPVIHSCSHLQRIKGPLPLVMPSLDVTPAKLPSAEDLSSQPSSRYNLRDRGSLKPADRYGYRFFLKEQQQGKPPLLVIY